MLNRCGWIRNTFVRKYHFLVINDHLWALSACGQILQKNPGRGQTPPHPGNACILGTSGAGPAAPLLHRSYKFIKYSTSGFRSLPSSMSPKNPKLLKIIRRSDATKNWENRGPQEFQFGTVFKQGVTGHQLKEAFLSMSFLSSIFWGPSDTSSVNGR